MGPAAVGSLLPTSKVSGQKRAVQGPPLGNAHSPLVFSPVFPVALCPPGLEPSLFELGADDRNVEG